MSEADQRKEEREEEDIHFKNEHLPNIDFVGCSICPCVRYEGRVDEGENYSPCQRTTCGHSASYHNKSFSSAIPPVPTPSFLRTTGQSLALTEEDPSASQISIFGGTRLIQPFSVTPITDGYEFHSNLAWVKKNLVEKLISKCCCRTLVSEVLKEDYAELDIHYVKTICLRKYNGDKEQVGMLMKDVNHFLKDEEAHEFKQALVEGRKARFVDRKCRDHVYYKRDIYTKSTGLFRCILIEYLADSHWVTLIEISLND